MGGRQEPDEASLPKYLIAEIDDLVVNPMWLIGGGIGVSQRAGAVSPDYRVFRSCGALLPTGNGVDEIDGIRVTMIDNGMPCVVFRAEAGGATGYETREELESEAFAGVRARIEAVRLEAGLLMNLGDVKTKSVPKMMLVAPPSNGGAVTVRSFIPHRAHAAIGVFGAVSVATACLITASAIVRALREFLPHFPDEVIASGGGVKNHVMMSFLKAQLAHVPLRTTDELGVPGDAKEAIAFALLAAATLDGVPANVPAATGARRRVVLGSVTPKP